MKLYHNADINDLNSIIKDGLLPLNVTGNNKWSGGKRSNNRKDVVYLFSPIGRQNSFIQYGAALIEVEVDNAEKSEMLERDINKGKYEEYTISHVPADKITKIYIPEIFKDKVINPGPIYNTPIPDVLSKIEWCDFDGDYLSADINDYAPMDDRVKDLFRETADVFIGDMLYFRGCNPLTRSVIDVYNIVYHTELMERNRL